MYDFMVKFSIVIQILGMIAFLIEWIIFKYIKKMDSKTKVFLAANMSSLAIGIVLITVFNFAFANSLWYEFQMMFR